jgi:hypothetical protein
MVARRLLAATFALMLSVGAAAADDLSLFNAAVEEFAAHQRVAIGYLRTENSELAALELDRMREAWGSLAERFGKDRPAVFRDNPRYTTALVDIPTRLVGASLMITMGRPDLARDALIAVRKELAQLRRASGVVVLADCVLDANTAMDALFAYRDQPPDWMSAPAVADLTSKAEAYGVAVMQCDRMAADDVRVRPEFRRLVDGIAASLALMPKASTTRDDDLFHRLLIELRSFDNLLAFRYG